MTKTENNEITFICEPYRIIYPRVFDFAEIPSGCFSVILVSVKEVISGSLPNDVFVNWDGTYDIKISGNMPQLYARKNYRVTCDIVEDPRYGLSFRVSDMIILSEITEDEKRRLFVEYAVGENKANLLYENLSDPYETLKNGDAKSLCKINGIGEITSRKMIDDFSSKLLDAENVIELKYKYGLTDLAINKLKEKYQYTDTILNNLRYNPYIIMEVDGIGWEKADRIALKNGYSKTGKYRVKAYINYYLVDQANSNGHSWVYLKELVEAIKTIIPELENKDLVEMLKDWTGRGAGSFGDMFLYYDENSKRIGLSYYRRVEENIADEIKRILFSKSFSYNDKELDDIISKVQLKNKWEFTNEQKDAIYSCLKNNITIITGKAGVGKTSIMEPVVKLLRKEKKSFVQVALAGKAASNLSEVTGEDGMTIHRLLEFDGESMKFLRNKENPIDYDVIIIDEMSLIGGIIFRDLISAVKSGAKIIAIGDTTQLESIGFANILKDCIESGVVPFYQLTKIHRQASRSAIITESIKISNGENIIKNLPINEVRGELQDLKVLTYLDQSDSKINIMKEYQDFLSCGISPDDITIVVPMRSRGEISCLSLNNSVQYIVNPESKSGCGWEIKKDNVSYTLRVGDRVINTKNNYNSQDKNGKVVPIFNGNVGKIKEIKKDSYIVVDFTQQGEVVIGRSNISDIELAYAITAHKMQGSQGKYIIVGIDISAYTLLSREWVYTAITRAKKYCSLIGQISAIRRASKISRVSIKQNWLKEILKNA